MTRPDGASVEFWFDPGCRFTWQTSRWLVDVAARRGVDVEWKLMSLSVLNAGRDKPGDYWERRRQADLALRVLAATKESAGSAAVGRLYGVVGRLRHEQDRAYDEELLRAAVAEAGLPAEVSAAARDESWDAAVRTSHDEAQKRVGTETGSPVLALDGGRGYFGPVVVPAPKGDDADRLFDALRLLSAVPAFSELKTSRAPL
jgi:2-hydroxychromene-2-carboxylate isomerase